MLNSTNVWQNAQVYRLPKLLLVSMFAALVAILSLVSSSAASAEARVVVTPYENLSTTAPTTVMVSGSGFTPNADVTIAQVEINYVETPSFTGDHVEQAHKAAVTTNAQGAFAVQVSVQYDVRPDLAFTNFCQNDYLLRRLCYLNVVQFPADELSDPIYVQPKLYFGVSGPVTDEPTPSAGPVSKDECFKDGWKTFGSKFENQGKCVAFVASNSRSSR